MPYPIPANRNIHVELRSFKPEYEMPAPEVYTDFYGIGFIIQGDRKSITPNMISILKEGDVGFTTKHRYHRTTYLTQTPYSRYLIKFTDKMTDNLLNRLHLNSIDELLPYPVYHFNPETRIRIRTLFSDMLTEYNNYDKYSELYLEGMLYQLLLIIAREHLVNSPGDIIINSTNPRILDAICYIDSHFSENPDINEVASYINFSASHFSRLFKENTGVTFSAYLASVKLQHAMSLLVHTEHSIEEIADLCGFPDSSYLCHIFKKNHNISPAGYRKAHKYTP